VKEDPEKKYPCGWIPDKNVCKWCMHFKCPKNTNFASRPKPTMLLEEIVGCFTRNIIYTERQRNDNLLSSIDWSNEIFKLQEELKKQVKIRE